MASLNLYGNLKFTDVIDGMKGPDLGDSDILKLTDESDAFFLHNNFSDVNDDLVLPQGKDSLNEIATARLLNIEIIKCGKGNDLLIGGAGNDILFGGAADKGNDVFEFTASSGHDQIKNFSEGD